MSRAKFTPVFSLEQPQKTHKPKTNLER